jgi:hypothetical protein
MRRTVVAPLGRYTGEKCPACPVVVQAGSQYPTLRAALLAHWVVCHPDHPLPQQ